jgi:hypothetical protein
MGTTSKSQGNKQGSEPKKSFHGNLLDPQLRRRSDAARRLIEQTPIAAIGRGQERRFPEECPKNNFDRAREEKR